MSDAENGKPPAEGETPDADAAAAEARAKAEAAARAKAEREAAEAAKPAWERDPAAPETVDSSEEPMVAALSEAAGEGGVVSATTTAGDLTLIVERGALRGVCRSLKDDYGYKLLVDICGAHYPKREETPFEVVYHVFNIEENRRVRVRVALAEGQEVPTVSGVWRGANWPERETWDMYGIRFTDHPDLTRILMWEGFNGHPLRKDFPVEGIDTGSAIYPEFYEADAGPVTGTGTGWRPAPPPAEEADETPAGEEG